MYGRGAGDMKSGTIGALFALDAIKAAGLTPTARIHFQSVIEEESTGVGALSTLQRGYRADCCFIPEPTDGQLVRAQVGVIWFRLRCAAIPCMSFDAGSGSNAIKAAYHLIQALEGLEEEWNTRALADKHFKAAEAPDQLQSRHHQRRRLGVQRARPGAMSIAASPSCRAGRLKIARTRSRPASAAASREHPFPVEQSAGRGMVGLSFGRLRTDECRRAGGRVRRALSVRLWRHSCRIWCLRRSPTRASTA